MHLLLPGSRDSVAEGCTCPTDANDYGAGAYTLQGVPQYYIDDACPIHGTQRTYAGAQSDEPQAYSVFGNSRPSEH